MRWRDPFGDTLPSTRALNALEHGVRRHARNARRAWRLAVWVIAIALMLPLVAELIGWMRRIDGR